MSEKESRHEQVRRESRAYRRGYYDFGDRIINWMNATDSSEMSVKEFRKALNIFVLSDMPAQI